MDWQFMARIMAIGSVVLAAGGTGEKDYPGMLNTLTGISLLTVMEVLGPIVLGGVLAYAIIHNRGRTRAERARTDAATRQLYDQEEKARRGREEA